MYFSGFSANFAAYSWVVVTSVGSKKRCGVCSSGDKRGVCTLIHYAYAIGEHWDQWMSFVDVKFTK